MTFYLPQLLNLCLKKELSFSFIQRPISQIGTVWICLQQIALFSEAGRFLQECSDSCEIQLFLLPVLSFQTFMYSQKPEVLRLNPLQTSSQQPLFSQELNSAQQYAAQLDQFQIAQTTLKPPQIEAYGGQLVTLKKSCRQCQGRDSMDSIQQKQEAIWDQNNEEEGISVILNEPSTAPGKEQGEELQIQSRHRLSTGLFVSSGDCQHDMQENSNQLPLASIYRPKGVGCYNEWDDSDDLNEFIARKRGIPTVRSYIKKRQESQEVSEDDDFTNNCCKCRQFSEKCIKLQQQSNQLQQKLSHIKEQFGKVKKIQRHSEYQSSTNSNDEISSSISLQPIESPNMHQLLSHYLYEAAKLIQKLLKGQSNQLEAFTEQSKQTITSFSDHFNALKKWLRIDEDDGNQKFAFLHERYKLIIDKLRKFYTEKLNKVEIDFKNVMASMAKRPFEGKTDHIQLCLYDHKIEHNTKKIQKSKTFIEKQPNDCFEMDQLRQKNIFLELKLEREKTRLQSIEKYAKKLIEKYSCQVKKLTKQKNIYAESLNKYNREFSSFMTQLAHKSIKFEFYEDNFFKLVSHRIFQISNSIPFEDNDEQNLFAPENEEQIFEMIERIRKFYFSMEEYNARKAQEDVIYKRMITIFLKELVDSEKVSLRVLSELIRKYKQLNLDYIKNYILAIKQKRSKQEDRRNSPLKRRGKGITDLKVGFELSDEADRQ